MPGIESANRTAGGMPGTDRADRETGDTPDRETGAIPGRETGVMPGRDTGVTSGREAGGMPGTERVGRAISSVGGSADRRFDWPAVMPRLAGSAGTTLGWFSARARMRV